MMKVAVYAGSFDPFTNGHEDVLLQSLKIFDKIYILIAQNGSKNNFLSDSIKMDSLQYYIDERQLNDKVGVRLSRRDQATTDFAEEHGAEFLIRGIRTVTDFDYEMQMHSANRQLSKKVETVYFTPKVENQFTSSSMVREIIRIKKDIKMLVPREIRDYLYKVEII